ncbi:asparagine synthase (glutamine-hydrolyzing) [Gaiella occulta]|uniref:asparagine synthase (glutamine-hydrolyzing) n=1 Tax=Gaiella occulta TaxID=1002870 RepID=A0A7M2Z2M0_9ACTN|nr:asparagine synthase (glutamine-hydrolyzing) [Gaiella occulta]RDI76254.1 asparagine synthase (glutamine-hydrolyzing) [Gaiella occulta]
MCGLAGVVLADREGRVERAWLEAMAAALAHRGPDGEAIWVAPGVGLASRRLAVIDPAGGGQPLANEDGSIVCVYNGEIYNFAGLRAELERAGHRFRSRTDGEVLCHLYEAEGDAMLARLRGMFAFALWDAQRGRLLLARDRFGVKPLYHARIPGGLAFASELKALQRLPGLGRDLDPVALSDYLTYLYVPAPRTILAAASKLEPGSLLGFQHGRLEQTRWWQPPPPGEGAPLTLEEAAAELRERLRETVRAHMVADVPVGAFLSGGLDSSTIVALMAEASPHPVKTFTVGFHNAGSYDERAAAKTVANHFDCHHHETIADRSLLAQLPSLVAAFDEPFADSSALPTYLVSSLAARELPVVLSGDGGDELFCGYDWYRYHQLLRPAGLLPPALLAPLAAWAAAGLPPVGRATGAAGRARRLLADAALDPLARYSRRISCLGEQARAALLADPVAGSGAAAAWYAFLPDGAGPVERMACADLALGLADDMLTKVDRASMAHGLEVRVPMLDPALAAFAWALPTSLKLRRLTGKRVLRHAVRDILPPGVLQRRKRGFGVPIGRWLREDPAGWSVLLAGSQAAADGYLRPAAVKALAERHLAGRAELGHQLWALLVFEVWYRLHAEGGEPRNAGTPLLAEIA